MRPSDARAIIAAEFLSTRKGTARAHMWEGPDSFLLIDNHRTLHARGDASAEPDRLLYRISFDLPGAAGS